jgi:rhodanese-related sulfurtransferase
MLAADAPTGDVTMTATMNASEARTMPVDAATLKAWLSDGCEIALLDIREHGQYGMGHLFFVVPLPYSRFELGLPALVPNRSVRLVLCDGGDGIAARAAARAAALGYANVFVLEGGVPAWDAAGHRIYAGVNVPSKVFGEIVEHQRHTPRISARDLEAMRERGESCCASATLPLIRTPGSW